MSNHLSMAKTNSIESLYQSGHSNRAIAKLLELDRGTVNKFVLALGSEILTCKFESIDISSDMIALVIEDADSWIDRYAPSVDYTRCIDIGAVAVSWGVLAISPVWNRIPDFYFDKPHIDMVKYDRYGRNLCRLPFH